MYFDRVRAKEEAKYLIRTARPSPILVTFLFILLTSGLSQLVGQFAASPFSAAVPYLMQGYDPMSVYAYVFGGTAAIVGIFLTILISFFSAIMSYGYSSYTLRLSRHQEGSLNNLIEGFGLATKVVGLYLLTVLFTSLWLMLFIIPGIVAAYSYSQAVYCLLDDPSIGPLEAIRRSKTMMRGQKFNFFVVQMSFMGWVLLLSAGVTLLQFAMARLFGVASLFYVWVPTLLNYVFGLWLTPYMNIVYSAFYNNLIGYGRNQEPRDTGYQGPEVEF